MILCEDATEQWHALPYELAHGLVKTLSLHCCKLSNAKEALATALHEDHAARRAKTQSLKNEVEKLQSCRRYMVLNRRTGAMATQDWMAKHIRVEDGKPISKKAGSKDPWVASMMYRAAGASAAIYMQLAAGEPDRRVRCIELAKGEERTDIADVMGGYEESENEAEQDEENRARYDHTNFHVNVKVHVPPARTWMPSPSVPRRLWPAQSRDCRAAGHASVYVLQSASVSVQYLCLVV